MPISYKFDLFCILLNFLWYIVNDVAHIKNNPTRLIDKANAPFFNANDISKSVSKNMLYMLTSIVVFDVTFM